MYYNVCSKTLNCLLPISETLSGVKVIPTSYRRTFDCILGGREASIIQIKVANNPNSYY